MATPAFAEAIRIETGTSEDLAAVIFLNQRRDDGRLAHTWFTPDDQAARGPVTSLFEKYGQVRGLKITAD